MGFFFLILISIESRELADFRIFIKASEELLNQNNIYKISYIDGFYYYYDVLFALIISPLQYIPLYWANFIWLALNLFFSYRIWEIIKHYLPTKLLNVRKLRLFSVLTFAFIFSLWHKNIHVTQMTIFILFLCLEGIYLTENKKPILASLCIGLGISIKILPIVLIPYFLYRGNFKVATYCVIATVVILYIPLFIIGYDYHLLLLNERWQSLNPMNSEHILDVTEKSFHSLTTLLSVLFVEDAGNNHSLDLKRNLLDLSHETLNIIINVTRLAFVSATLFFIRSWPFRKAASRLQTFYELSYILLIIPLIFPHQQHYSFFLALPAISYLVFFYIQKYYFVPGSFSTLNKYGLIVLASIVFLLLNSHFLVGEYRNIYDHYKTLTYGIIMIIPILAMARPNALANND